MKYKIIDKHGYKISSHRSIEAANRALKRVDSVKYSVYAPDFPGLTFSQEANQGYNYSISPE